MGDRGLVLRRFVGSSLAAVVASGLASAGHCGVLFRASAVLAVPPGAAAATARARWHYPDEPSRPPRGVDTP